MPSIHRQPNRPFWFCAFYDANGRRRFKSTKTANHTEARAICRAWASAAAKARQGALGPERAREVIEQGIAEILEQTGRSLPRASIRAYFEGWLKGKEVEAAESSVAQYKSAVEDFLAFLGPRKEQSLVSLGADDVRAYRASVADRLSATTTNFKLQVLRTVLGSAVREQLLTSNPAALVDKLRRADAAKRRAFTVPELKKLLGCADETWRGMVLFGLYTGLRLADCAGLTWHNLDLEQQELAVTTQKTGRTQILPLAKPLLEYLEGASAGDDPSAPLFPDLAGRPSRTLSGRFRQLLVQAGLVRMDCATDHKRAGRRRTLSELSFHSLRHTATSLLKRAGVSDAIAMDIIGHESVAVSRNYSHIDSDTKRAALNKLPDISS